ncbi:MAG: hypothetical protein WKF30_01575 [Pyrinomonadaceae bacterium]
MSAQPKKWTKQDADTGRDQEAIRLTARLLTWKNEQRDYSQYARVLKNLLALKPQGFDPVKLPIKDLSPPRSMGDANTIYGLQNYVVGLAQEGLTLQSSNTINFEKSFERINYLRLIQRVAVRNNVQARVGSRPVDFIALYVTRAALRGLLPDEELPDEEAIWLYGGDDRQALILSRQEDGGKLWLKYLPVAGLSQQNDGSLIFQRISFQSDLPLKIYEDANLNLPASARDDWLQAWHTDEAWLNVLFKTKYSNALIGLHEQFARHGAEMIDPDAAGIDKNARVVRRFRFRQRRLIEADMLVFANNHWNFDVRGFNPGGNHGSFFRISTHSMLMFAGGSRTGIPIGRVVDKPYDSLSFAPTLLTMLGMAENGRPAPRLRERGFRQFPGPVISEIMPRPEQVKDNGR